MTKSFISHCKEIWPKWYVGIDASFTDYRYSGSAVNVQTYSTVQNKLKILF